MMVDQDVGELLALSPEDAADKPLAGDIDAMAMLASWDAPVVQHSLPTSESSFSIRHARTPMSRSIRS
jgi:hypothetical protein